MKVRIACLTVLAAMTAGYQQAVAADFGNVPPGGVINGGIRDYGGAGGVPVPAPVPIPEYKPSFYFRVDAGYGVLSSETVTEDGAQYGQIINRENGYSSTFGNGPDIQAFDPAWLSSDFANLTTYGVGVGYYIGSGWRMDATLEGRSRDEININGSDDWMSHGYVDDDLNPSTPALYTTDLNNDLTLDDRATHANFTGKTEFKGTVWMANIYYDLMKTDRGLTPYVGAGLGFVWNEFNREHTTTVTSCDNLNPCAGPRTEYSKSTNTKTDTVSLAAALMAGASYQMTDVSSLDVGYRFLYLGGTGFTSDVDGYASTISISDQYIHQVRAGLRFDVN
jgi:opacity protein-like surface antigen